MPDEVIRVAIGTEPKTHIARKVLEHSITRRTRARVEFTPLIGPRWEYPADLKVGTGFSLRRWMIPEYFSWEGHALYLDADQIVLGDIAELWALRAPSTDAVICCTHQPDKFSPKTPVPQTSVMLIDCARARDHWGFHLAQVINHLRMKPTRDCYSRFMHAEWLVSKIADLPVGWNHLNVHNRDTKLLHYTKEPEQPWYRPDHPLAGLWKVELAEAMRDGVVTRKDLAEALARWDVKEDWRTTNGLHPAYAPFLKGDPRQAARRGMAAAPRRWPSEPLKPAGRPSPHMHRGKGLEVLWATSFAQDMYDASGRKLIESFGEHDIPGRLLVAAENCAWGHSVAYASRIVAYDLDTSAFLQAWLDENADIIPVHLGGKHDGLCRCPGGPFAPHDKRHRMPCVGHWFNRNASRWFRKVATLCHARTLLDAGDPAQAVIWVDADCVFRKPFGTRIIESWFRLGALRPGDAHPVAAFYCKHKRPVLEAGCFGFSLQHGGRALLDALIARYESGAFRKDKRWDDSAQLQVVLEAAVKRGVRVADLAYAVGEHAAVIPHSALGPFITHMKGHHSRGLGIMT